MKLKFIKTGKLWEVSGEQAIKLALNPDYEVILMSQEEENQLQKYKEDVPKTDEQLFLGE